MRRLLLIAYAFPPDPAAGAQRPGYLARYLREFGWAVTVLTRPSKEARAANVVEVPVPGEAAERAVRAALASDRENGARPASALRRALRWGREALFFPDRNAAWILPAVRRGSALARKLRFDAIVSTAMPASVHVVGAAIAARYAIPWIADYRDPWAGNAYVRRHPLRRMLEESLERTLLGRANDVTAVSESIAASLHEYHGSDAFVIPNAADPSAYDGLEGVEPENFALCYTGSLYDGKRSPALLFEALAALRRDREPAAGARVDFYGPNSAVAGSLARRYGVESIVACHGTVPRREALVAQRSASTLLAFLSTDERTERELGSKILEYAVSRRPTIAFGPRNSALRGFIERLRLGWFASDLAEAKDALRDAHRRFVAGEREVSIELGAVFEARDLARAFARRLDAVV